MKKRFLTPIFFMSIITLMAQEEYLQEFQQKWSNAQAYTMEVLEIMPEESFGFKPSVEQMSFQEQVLHIAGNIRWLTSDYLGGKRLAADLKKEDYTKSEITDILQEAFANAAEAIGRLSSEALRDEVSFFAGPMTKRQILTLLNDHLTHHRAQLIVYLRLKGLEPPKYRGW